MNRLILFLLIMSFSAISFSQCSCSYTYSGAIGDTITFTNQSTVSNAHYYWEFGDGLGSNDFSPSHVYFSSGLYLVTLFALDTINNCSDAYQEYVTVIKPDTSVCNIYFEDTITGNFWQMNDYSTNCNGYSLNCRLAGPGFNFCNTGFGNWYPGLFLNSKDAFTHDSIRGYVLFDHWVRTLPYQYDKNKNYQPCSANFEVLINDNQEVLF